MNSALKNLLCRLLAVAVLMLPFHPSQASMIGAGHVSYFFEAKRRRLSPPRPDVLAVDIRRQLIAQADGRAVAVRLLFSGREVARLDRDWAPGPLRAAITAIHFDPDTRLTLSYLRGASREPVTERLSISVIPRRK